MPLDLQIFWLPTCKAYYGTVSFSFPLNQVTQASIWIQTESDSNFVQWFQNVIGLAPAVHHFQQTGSVAGADLTQQELYSPLIYAPAAPTSVYIDIQLADGEEYANATASYAAGVKQYNGVPVYGTPSLHCVSCSQEAVHARKEKPMSTTYLIQYVCTRFALFALEVCIFLLVACGSRVSGSTTTVPTSHLLASAKVTTTPVPNSNLFTILPELQQSLQVMLQVQTANVDRQDADSDQWLPSAGFCAPDPL